MTLGLLKLKTKGVEGAVNVYDKESTSRFQRRNAVYDEVYGYNEVDA